MFLRDPLKVFIGMKATIFFTSEYNTEHPLLEDVEMPTGRYGTIALVSKYWVGYIDANTDEYCAINQNQIFKIVEGNHMQDGVDTLTVEHPKMPPTTPDMD